MALLHRPQSSAFSVIRDRENGIYNSRGWDEISFRHPEDLKIRCAFWNSGDAYIQDDKFHPHLIDLNGASYFIGTLGVGSTPIEVTVTDVLQPSNTKRFTTKAEIVHNLEEDQFASNQAIAEMWKSDQDLYNLTLEYSDFAIGNHLWKIENVSNLPSNKVMVTNRFALKELQGDVSVCSAFIASHELEICYREGDLKLSEKLKLINSVKVSNIDHVVEFIDLVQDLKNENIYYLIVRQSTGFSHEILWITIVRLVYKIKIDANPNKFSSLSSEIDKIQTAWNQNLMVLSYVDPGKLNSLVLQSPNCSTSQFFEDGKEPRHVMSFSLVTRDLWPQDEETRNNYLFVLNYNDDQIQIYEVDIKGCKAVKFGKTISLPFSRKYNTISCSFIDKKDKYANCILGGVVILSLEVNLEEEPKAFNLKEYMPYKNLEIESVVHSRHFFLVQFSRPNADPSVVHDASGIVYYERMNVDGKNYFSGGISNTDLLNRNIPRRYKMHLLDSSTLLIHFPGSVTAFSIGSPKIAITELTFLEKIEGPKVSILGHSLVTLQLAPKENPPKQVDRQLQMLIVMIIGLFGLVMIVAIVILRIKRHEKENAQFCYTRNEDNYKSFAASKNEVTYTGSILS